MIELSNRHCLEYMTGSGALAYDGQGWPWEWPLVMTGLIKPEFFTSIVRTLTLKPERGNFNLLNPFGCIRIIPNGVVNAVGLYNIGIEKWAKKYGPKINSKKIPIIGSIFGKEEIAESVNILNDFDLVGLEVNISCPNIKGDVLNNPRKAIRILETAKENSRFPILAKISIANEGLPLIIQETKSFVEAIDINSIPWKMIFSNQKSPLEKFGGGGVSGKITQFLNWNLIAKLKQITEIPIIGPGIWDFEDMEKVRKIGASAISFSSVFMCHPLRPTSFVKKERA